ncbi:hypothetical protein GCM10022295_83240 [Streptomyces osmaniensis]|uniref:Uncharacterized protein n=4 Tax=Streptomyces TaxID=1883 RepID=A0ABP6YQW4_9ACTN
MRQNTEPKRLLCLWVETSNTSLNGTGASCVAQGLTDTKSLRQSAAVAGMTITTRVVKTGWMRPHAPGGLLFVALGLILVAAGYVWRGRVLRPLSAKRAQAAVIRDRSRNLLRSADMAIAGARRRAAHGEPAIVTVGDVTRVARRHYGYLFVEREEAAAALRQRYEAADCRVDCMTDAFN